MAQNFKTVEVNAYSKDEAIAQAPFQIIMDATQAWKAAGSVEADKPKAVARFVNLHPTVDWRNTFSMRIAKYFTTTFYCQMLYDKAANQKVRIQSELKIGFSYTFKNK